MKKFKLHLIILMAFSLLFSFNSFGQTTTNFGDQSGGLDEPNYSGDNGSFFGFKAGEINTSGTWNTFIGSHTGVANTTSAQNTFIGMSSGRVNTTANFNVFIGMNSGRFTTTGGYNVYIGHSAKIIQLDNLIPF